MIGIGINENVILKKVEIVDKDGKMSVDFSLTTAGAAAADDTDPFGEAVDENGMLVTGNGNGLTVKVWPINVPDETDKNGATKSIATRIEEANNATKEMQNMFTLFARCYLTSDKIKFERFRGIPITKDTTAMLLDESVLVAVTRNLASQFIEMCSQFFGDETQKIRILLRRQSAKKHYPAFRDKLLQAFPFVESMAVPKEASKIAFTKFEIEKKFNSAHVLTETDDIPDAAPTAPADPSSLFGGGIPGTPTADLSSAPELN